MGGGLGSRPYINAPPSLLNLTLLSSPEKDVKRYSGVIRGSNDFIGKGLQHVFGCLVVIDLVGPVLNTVSDGRNFF